MEPQIAGIILLILFCLARFHRLESGLSVLLAFIPFGTASVFNVTSLGGAGIMPLHLGIVLLILSLIPKLLLQLKWGTRLPFNRLTLGIGVLILYSGLVTLLSPFLFEGKFMVFPISRIEMIKGGILTNSVPLAFSPGNITQAGYFIISFLFLIVLITVARQRNLSPALHNGLTLACILNLVLGLMDFLQLDNVLSILRVTNVSFGNEGQIAGINRVIGGFSEASLFGPVSLAFTCYFFYLFLHLRKVMHFILAGCSFLMAILSLSSTAYIGMGLVGVSFLLHSLLQITRRRTISAVHLFFWIASAFSFAVVPIAYLYLPQVENIVDSLLFTKVASNSADVRFTLSLSSWDAFLQTYGFGAGLGSVRSNGWLFAYLAAIGLPGVLLLTWIFKSCLSLPRRARPPHRYRAYFVASQQTALVVIGMNLVSNTLVDPGILLISLMALAYTSCRYQASEPEPVTATPPATT